MFNIPTATSALTRGLPSATTGRRLLTILSSALIFSSSSQSSTPCPSLKSYPTSRRVPKAKTAEALTWRKKNYPYQDTANNLKWQVGSNIMEKGKKNVSPRAVALTVEVHIWQVHLTARLWAVQLGNPPRAFQDRDKATEEVTARSVLHQDLQVADVSSTHESGSL